MPNDNPYFNPPAQAEPQIVTGSYTPSAAAAPAAAKGPSLWDVLKAKHRAMTNPGQADMALAQQRRLGGGQ